MESGIYDVQGGTTAEGIHAGVMGGSVYIVVKGFAGVEMLEDRIKISPNLPNHWRSIKLNLVYRGVNISLSITNSHIFVAIPGSVIIPIEVGGKIYYPSASSRTIKILLKKNRGWIN